MVVPIFGFQVLQSASLLAVVLRMQVLGIQGVAATAASVFVHGIVPDDPMNP